MKNLAQRLIFSADCSQSMGLTPEPKIRRFDFFFFKKIRPKLKDPPPKSTLQNRRPVPQRYCLYQNTIHGGGRGIEWSTLPPKRDAWKKLRKERKKFSKLLIFSTDCSQPMGLQSVIKIRGKTSKLFALHSSPFQWSSTYWIIVTLRIVGPV